MRRAIRVDDRTLLAVPAIPPGTSRERRVEILELVLRRQPTHAAALAAGELDPPPKRGTADTIAGFIARRPHSGGWAA